MILEFLNYQPFYYLIGLRMFHILLIIPIVYFIRDIKNNFQK